jgi:hypothetical protein
MACRGCCPQEMSLPNYRAVHLLVYRSPPLKLLIIMKRKPRIQLAATFHVYRALELLGTVVSGVDIAFRVM